MSLCVLAFAAKQPEPIFQAVKDIVQGRIASLSAVLKLDEQEMVFEPLTCTFEEALAMLASDRIVSLIVKLEHLEKFNVIINRPFIWGDALPLWYAELDGLHAYEDEYFLHIQHTPGMQFVSLSFEDSIDFSNQDSVTKETFPWDDWRLIKAVVANSDGDTTQSEVVMGSASRASKEQSWREGEDS